MDELIDEAEDEETVIENRGGLLFVNSVETHIPFNDAPKFVQDNLAAAPAADCVVNTSPVNKEPVKPKNPKEVKNMEIKTVDDLRGAYPELVGAIEAAAAETAAASERQRIRDIEEMCLSGSEDFANEAKFEKPISAADYAMQAVKNAKQTESAKKQAYLDGVKNDVADSGMDGVAHETTAAQQDEFMDAIKAMGQKK